MKQVKAYKKRLNIARWLGAQMLVDHLDAGSDYVHEYKCICSCKPDEEHIVSTAKEAMEFLKEHVSHEPRFGHEVYLDGKPADPRGIKTIYLDGFLIR